MQPQVFLPLWEVLIDLDNYPAHLEKQNVHFRTDEPFIRAVNDSSKVNS